MKIEIFEKARDLGEEIAASDEFRKLSLAQSAYDADDDMQACLSRVEELNCEIDLNSDEFVALKQLEQLKVEVALLKEQIAQSPTLKELREASAAFTNLMAEVNQVISFEISGRAAGAFVGESVMPDRQQVH